MPKKTVILVGLLTLSLAVLLASAASAQENMEIGNEYIKIVVNGGELNGGRFSVGTTGGDPGRESDDNKALIYGGDDPWTSYTTVRVDNQNWIYGNPTDRRAGFDGLYGELVQPPTLVDGKIESSWRLGPVQVWQVLSITRSSTTGLMDTAQIEYHVENLDTESHMVGLRLMLDTMLGANDGAPFRVEDRALTTDTVYYTQNMPEFWQAFDSLSNPQVMAQGTLRKPGIVPPDRTYFTNWGSVADAAWNFDFIPGRDFTRVGEWELDSAIALFWDPVVLGPGEARSYVTYYGLGGVTIAAGELIVGVTSPAQVPADTEGFQTFSIIAYVQNDGEGEALDVVAELKLPKELELVGSPAKASLGDLPAGETKQTGWQIRAQSNAEGLYTYEVVVTSTNSETNRVRRAIEVLSPARLQVMVSAPPALGVKDERFDPSTFDVTVFLRNEGGTAYYGGTFELLHPMLELLPGQSAKRFPGTIEAGQDLSFKWVLKPQAGYFGGGPLGYSLRITSPRGEQTVRTMSIIIPLLKPKVWVGEPEVAGGGLVTEGQYFKLPIWATNIPDFLGVELDLSFDPDRLEIVGKTLDISMGTLFASEGESPATVRWTMPFVANDTGQILGLKAQRSGKLNNAYGTVMTIYFRAKQAGLARVSVENARVIIPEAVLDPSYFEVEHRDILIQPR
ncbi:MAG: hypothetical protein ACOX53_04765 [Limnochordia bacterium]|jgi:hypothetical protein